ncbi:MAG: hypothetical protein JXD22_11600 [Sedimentisphaerales bacterium]|nr:hypothetical protein [Sedimentisphaerales bacterium]
MKIQMQAFIKSCKITAASGELTVSGLQSSNDEYEKIAELIKEKEVVTLTLEPVQDRMFGDEDDYNSEPESKDADDEQKPKA